MQEALYTQQVKKSRLSQVSVKEVYSE